MIPQPNKIDIEQQDPLDPQENLQLAQHSDVQAAAFATLGIGLLVPAVFLFIVLVTAITPTIIHLAWLLGLWLLALTTPWLTLAYLHARRIFWHDRHQRKLFHWAEARMKRDLDGDGAIGMVVHDQSWFTQATRHWYLGGSTTWEASRDNLRLSYAQWQAARDALIHSGLAVQVKRQGRGKGFEMKPMQWGQVLSRLPREPYIAEYTGEPDQTLAFARDPVSSLPP